MLTFGRVFVPVDFSELTETVVRYGIELTAPEGRCVLFHVLEPLPLHFETAFGTFVNREGFNKIRVNARKLLEDLAADHKTPEVVTELREGKPEVEILAAAERHRAELIVLGTHGRGGLEHLFLGSVAARVVRKARCPVLTVRQPARRSSPGD